MPVGALHPTESRTKEDCPKVVHFQLQHLVFGDIPNVIPSACISVQGIGRCIVRGRNVEVRLGGCQRIEQFAGFRSNEFQRFRVGFPRLTETDRLNAFVPFQVIVPEEGLAIADGYRLGTIGSCSGSQFIHALAGGLDKEITARQ